MRGMKMARDHGSTPSVSIQLQARQQQQIQLTQRLMMSVQMQQAIRLLQLPLLELKTFIEEQVILNPLLEWVESEEETASDQTTSIGDEESEQEQEISIQEEDFSILARLEEEWRDHFADSEPIPIKRSSEEEKLKTYLEQSIPFQISFHDRLIQQAHDSFENEKELELAKLIIGYIDETGFLRTPLAEISSLHSVNEDNLKPVLAEIQTFEPYGVGAANIQQALLIQLRCLNKRQTLAYRMIKDHYERLIHNRIPLIQKYLKCSYQDIESALKDISKLNLHPGASFSTKPTHPIIPDVTLRQENQELFIEVERDYVPPLRLNLRYLKLLEDPSLSKEHKQFIKHHLFSARWLVRNLQQRYSTLERIAQSLAKTQYDFFTQPNGQLIPLTMKTLADELQVHESTIARTVSNKYIYSPRGLFPLRSFFTNKYVSEEGKGLSSTTVKQAILAFINQEDKQHPLSDQKISTLLKKQGIHCARRTVAKYRLASQIGNTQQRRKFN
jgi:RNA polymerase sigma-54 factor